MKKLLLPKSAAQAPVEVTGWVAALESIEMLIGAGIAERRNTDEPPLTDGFDSPRGDRKMPISSARANAIVSGIHKRKDILEMFGPPTTVTLPRTKSPQGGIERWTYRCAYRDDCGLAADALVISFDRNGLVLDRGFSHSHSRAVPVFATKPCSVAQ